MSKRLIAIALFFLPLTGCGDGEFSRMIPLGGGGGGGGGSYSAPAPAPTMIPRSVGQPDLPGSAASKMLTDADEPYNSQVIDYVWGDTESQAIARCEAIAAQAGLRFRSVRQTSKNGKKWECHVDNL